VNSLLATAASPTVLVTGRETMFAAGAALAGGAAALSIRGWKRGWGASALGGVLFGVTPAVLSILDGPLTPLLLVIPPAVFLVLSEALVRQRIPWWIIGALAGAVAAAAPLHTPDLVIAILICTAIAVVVLAALRPGTTPLGVSNAVRVVVVAVPVYLLGSAYPVAVHVVSPTWMSISVADNHGDLAGWVSGATAWIHDQVSTSSPFFWIAGALLIALVIDRLRRSRVL